MKKYKDFDFYDKIRFISIVSIFISTISIIISVFVILKKVTN